MCRTNSAGAQNGKTNCSHGRVIEEQAAARHGRMAEVTDRQATFNDEIVWTGYCYRDGVTYVQVRIGRSHGRVAATGEQQHGRAAGQQLTAVEMKDSCTIFIMRTIHFSLFAVCLRCR